MIRLVAAAVLALLPVSACAKGCTGPVCNFDTLAPLVAKFEAARGAKGQRPVHILQIGDSHTAGDVLTGAWRDILQADFGEGGRGMLPPGRPYPGYRTRGVAVTMSDGWEISATYPRARATRAPLGLSSFTATATRAGAAMAITAETRMRFDRFVLCAVAGPGAASLIVKVGEEAEHSLDFANTVVAPRCETMRFDAPQSAVSMSATGPVTITSWGTFRDDGGVALSNVGIVGSQLMHFARTDDAMIAEELRAYAPDLIILAFGTNEGFGPGIDTAAYEATLRSQIERFRSLAPEVPILLLGPPDALSRQPGLRGGASDCPRRAGIKPLFAPPGLAQVRAIQRRIAGLYRVAWWDWQARMGGRCSAQAWVNAVPPRMAGDYVHFRDAGGAILARALQNDLIRAGEAQ